MHESLDSYSIALPHQHTSKSDGMVSPSEVVYAMAELRDRIGINVIGAITDHETIQGIPEAQKAAACRGIELIPGQEISVGRWPSKHVVALYPEEPVNPLFPAKTVEGTLDRIKCMNGLVIAAHPGGFNGFASLTPSEITNLGNRDLIDGLEVISGPYDRRLQLAETLNILSEEHPVAEIASADSHYGKADQLTAYTLFPGKTVEDFFIAVRNGTTLPVKGFKDTVPFAKKVLQFGYSNGILNIRRHILHNLH